MHVCPRKACRDALLAVTVSPAGSLNALAGASVIQAPNAANADTVPSMLVTAQNSGFVGSLLNVDSAWPAATTYRYSCHTKLAVQRSMSVVVRLACTCAFEALNLVHRHFVSL